MAVIENSTSYTLVSGTTSDDTIKNFGSQVTIKGLAGNDSITTNGGRAISITGDNGDDFIQSPGFISGSIFGGLGNDTIQLKSGLGYVKSGTDGLIDGGDGNDSIINGYSGWAGVSNLTIYGGAGNDYIYSNVYNCSIIGGDEKDSIRNTGLNATITGGKGNDFIDNRYEIRSSGAYSTIDGDYALFQYTSGDGNDIIYGFKNNSTLSISGDSYSTTESDSDIVVTVGDGKISLMSAASLSTVNIVGTEDDSSSDSKLITLTEGNDTYENFISDATIQALGGNDSVENSAEKVLINGDAGNDTIGNDSYGKNATLNGGAGDDYIWNNANALVNGDDGSDTISNRNGAAGATVFGGAGNDSILNSSAAKIYGGTGDDTISNTNLGANATLHGGDGNDLMINYDSENVSIDAGAGNDIIWLFNSNDALTVGGGTGNDTIQGVSLTGNVLYQYAKGDGNDIIYSFDNDDTLKISGGSYSTEKSGSNIIVTVGDGKISLMGAASLSAVNIDGTEEETPKNYWTLDGNTATYGDLITVKGVKSLDGIDLNGTTVTIAKNALNAKKVTISNGYTLALADDVNESTTKKSWSLSNSTATYKQTITAGYSLEDNEIIYSKKATSTLATVTGVKSTSGLKVNGTTVTISNSALNAKKVTISDGYTLKLGSDVSKSTTKKAWNLSNSTATYKQTTTAGYSLVNNAITYIKVTNKALATVKGVKSTNGLKVSGKVVTVSNSALNAKKVTITDGYTLKLGSDVSKSTTKKVWNLSNSTATYKQTTTAGYSLVNNAINYTKVINKALATVKGVKSTNGLKVSGKVVTVSNSALNAKKVTISDGYTLKLGSDVSKSTTKKAWNLSNSTATYKQTTTAGYSLVNNAITYTKATNKALATVKGVKSTKGLSVSNETITLKNSALKNKVTVSGDYEFDFAADYKNAAITGSKNSDTIIARGENITINGGAGDDVLMGGNKNIFVYNSGNDIITNYDEADKISIKSGAAEITTNGDDVIFNGKLTVQGGADKTVTYIDASGENIYSKSTDDYKIDGKTVTILDNYTKESFNITNENSIQTIDASAAQLGLEITGNKLKNKIIGSSEDDIIYGMDAADTILGEEGNDTLVGGKGNDCLSGGAGDDSLWGGVGTDTLFGGDGADTFVYQEGDGKVIIDDFDGSLDKIRVLSGNVDNPFTNKAGDVMFDIGDGQIIVSGGSDKFIPIYDKGKNILVQYKPNK